MAGDPAIVKITDALVAALQAGMTGVNIFADRSDEQPIEEFERPAVALRVIDIKFDPSAGMSEIRHLCTIDFDLYEAVLTEGRISSALARMIVDLNTVIAADRTVGDRVESFELNSATAELDAIPDLGCATVTADLTFRTPRGDFTTILGAGAIH